MDSRRLKKIENALNDSENCRPGSKGTKFVDWGYIPKPEDKGYLIVSSEGVTGEELKLWAR